MTSLAVLTLALAPVAPPAEPNAPDVKECVQDGLKWLATQQQEDGSWRGSNSVTQTTISATAGLALLMEGSTLKAGAYATNIRKALEWIEKNASANGALVTPLDMERSQSLSSQAQAILFLSCVYDVDEDENRRTRVAKLLEKAVVFTLERQTSRGGWAYFTVNPGTEFDEGHTTALVLQALFAARKVGIVVPKKSIDRAIDYLMKSTNRVGGIIYSIANGARPKDSDGQPYITAAAAKGLLMDASIRPELLPKWVKFANANNDPQFRFLRDGTGGVYTVLHFYELARMMFALGETGYQRIDSSATDTKLRWSTFRQPLFKALKDTQKKDGYWADLYGAPVYTTSLALVILQLDNEYLQPYSR
ncbi:MAG: hypothetical protein L0241_01820 [Planctomycetia bacterium]|nr:hypothetical protein [Planctomycetia bacterium]